MPYNAPILAFLLLVGLATPAQGQGAGWFVENPTGEILTVHAWDPKERVWRPVKLRPSERQGLPFVSVEGTGRMRIATYGRGVVEHVVRAGRSYFVRWDRGLNIWTFGAAGY